MYAIVEIGAKQFKVHESDKLYVPRLQAEVDDTVTLDRVLLVAGDDVQIGTPTLEGASITARVLGHVKADKVLIFRKKRRKRFKVKRGQRQQYTQIEVDAFSLEGKKSKAKAKKEASGSDENA